MSLITKVKAGAVSSLSDARFFAGMGVDWLGFDVDATSESFVSIDLYKSLVGWVSGPKRVIELPSPLDDDLVKSLIEEYHPDYVEIDLVELEKCATDLPIFARVNLSDVQEDKITNRVKYLVLQVGSNPFGQSDLISRVARKTRVLLSVAPDFREVKRALDELPVSGIALRGSRELQTGIKVYDYSDLLESLESDE